MTQSVIFLFEGMSIWSILFVVILLAVVLSILLIIVPKYSEDGEPRRKQREYKPTRYDKLVSLGIGIIMFCLIVIILTIVSIVIGNNLNQAVINCANCTVALNG